MKTSDKEINQAFQVLQKITEATGNKKLEILKSNAHNPMLKELFRLAYRSDLNFFVRPEPEWLKDLPKTEHSHHVGMESFLSHLDMLSKRTVSNARDSVKSFLRSPHLTEVERLVYFNVLSRDLRVGLNAVSINKIWPDLLVDTGSAFKGAMLAHEWNEGKLKFPCYAEPKLDGIRLTMIPTDGVHRGYTRNGNTYPAAKFIEEAFKDFPGMVFDGEVMAENWNETSSLLKTSKKIDWDRVKNELFFHVFDAFPVESYENGSETPYRERRKNLVNMFIYNLSDGPITLVKAYRVESMEALQSLFAKVVDEGYEGLVLKQPDGVYKIVKGSTRPVFWMKLKPERDETVTITGSEEGTGKNVGRLGAFVCKDEKGQTYRVGSGFNDEQRVDFWKRRKTLVGKKIDVVVDDFKGDGIVARFPRFKRFREEA